MVLLRIHKILILLALCIGVCLAIGQEQNEKKPAGTGTTVRVRVDMVSFSVVVTGREGNHIKDLKKEDFQVYQDGVLQEIAAFSPVEEPISVALALDASGSTELQLSRIRNEAMRFVNLLRQDDSIALLSFADEVTLLEPFNIYHKKNTNSLRLIKSGGLSAVYDAVWLTLEQVLSLEYGRKAMVLLSDGIDTRIGTTTREETLELARRSDATIYCVYFNTDKNRGPRFGIPRGKGKRTEYAAGLEYMHTLAKSTGGLLVDTSRSQNLTAAFRKIAEELWSQYSIGYYPKDLKHDGAFHNVTVKALRPDLTIRARSGFYDFK